MEDSTPKEQDTLRTLLVIYHKQLWVARTRLERNVLLTAAVLLAGTVCLIFIPLSTMSHLQTAVLLLSFGVALFVVLISIRADRRTCHHIARTIHEINNTLPIPGTLTPKEPAPTSFYMWIALLTILGLTFVFSVVVSLKKSSPFTVCLQELPSPRKPRSIPSFPPDVNEKDIMRRLEILANQLRDPTQANTSITNALRSGLLNTLSSLLALYLADPASASSLAKSLLEKFLEGIASESGKQLVKAIVGRLLHPPPKSMERAGEMREKVAAIHSTIRFDFDSPVPSPSGYMTVSQITDLANGDPQALLFVVGYADRVGTNLYNRKLALSRAEAIADLLRHRGVEPWRIVTASYGEDLGHVTTPDATSEPENRAVTVTVF